MNDEIEEKIVESYYRYYDNVLQQSRYSDADFQCVLKVRPDIFAKLRTSMRCFNDGEWCWIELCGFRTPILIEKDLPENVEFSLQGRRAYETEEREKLLKKFIRMFR